ncbi:MAG: hypothetical protein JWM59_1118 [Verrucomicrobiales bacterium]|nr:hypothetical protein [Verrucomicrobiales bacterium]
MKQETRHAAPPAAGIPLQFRVTHAIRGLGLYCRAAPSMHAILTTIGTDGNVSPALGMAVN